MSIETRSGRRLHVVTKKQMKTGNLDKFLSKSGKKENIQLDSTCEADKMAGDHEDPNKEMKVFINEALDKQTNTLAKKFDEINAQLTNLKEITNQLEKAVSFNSEGIETTQTNIDQLRREYEKYREDMDKRFLTQELYLRKQNILVYGIGDGEKPETACRALFAKMGLRDDMDFVTIHRLPRQSTNPRTQNSPKPIMVKFVKLSDRQAVIEASFTHAAMLRNQKVSIRTDLPVPLKKYRGKLATKAFNLRTERKVQTKIYERGIDVILEYRKDSQSPWNRIDLDEEIKI